MTREELINEIQTAFKGVTLEDGIGLWEGKGIDDYADHKTIRELRKKDERVDWNNISYEDLAACASSLSFFDAKGMRFCLPKILIFDILDEQIYEERGLYAPDVQFTLTYELDGAYQHGRFSLLNAPQKQCVVHYLEYRLHEIVRQYEEYNVSLNTSMSAIESDVNYIKLKEAIHKWKERI